MTRNILCVVLIVLLTLASAGYMAVARYHCELNGGLLLYGLFKYECVRVERVKI
jgi:hypothetical protein